MSDLPSSDPMPEPTSSVPGGEQELEVDLAAFLPEGVVLGDDTVVEEEIVVIEAGDEVVVVDEVTIDTGDDVVVIDEIAVATVDEVTVAEQVVVDGVVVDELVIDEVLTDAAPAGEPAPAVDLEALSQIERDLDAVDAAIAALDAGTYGIDPATGQRIDDAVLAEDPTRLS